MSNIKGGAPLRQYNIMTLGVINKIYYHVTVQIYCHHSIIIGPSQFVTNHQKLKI